jgi:hypothetical protein
MCVSFYELSLRKANIAFENISLTILLLAECKFETIQVKVVNVMERQRECLRSKGQLNYVGWAQRGQSDLAAVSRGPGESHKEEVNEEYNDKT